MKIIAILESSTSSGGAFNQGLNAIMQMSRICEGKFEFEVITPFAENIQALQEFRINCILFKPSLAERIIALVKRITRLRAKNSRRIICGLFETKLLEHGADVVYFLTQSVTPGLLQQLNYITTVFDLCHRDTPEFPEVRGFVEFHSRELHFKNNLAPALLVITESENLSNKVSQRYGIDHERCLAMPMSPSPFLQGQLIVDKHSVLQIYDLEEGYFFYPAQFWAHKNHVRILEALVLLREAGTKLRLVLTGGDKGNRAYIENLSVRYSLDDQVRFLGFTPAEHMRGLYEGCMAVVMPTYFGPTNLPPLEAWTLGKPLVYSSHLKEQAGNAAVYANPDSATELAAAMKACTDPDTVTRLVLNGTIRLHEIEQQRRISEIALTNRLLQFEARRKCWR
jgi:glycosyltransferase involved in cell wall biosynthesis